MHCLNTSPPLTWNLGGGCDPENFTHSCIYLVARNVKWGPRARPCTASLAEVQERHAGHITGKNEVLGVVSLFEGICFWRGLKRNQRTFTIRQLKNGTVRIASHVCLYIYIYIYWLDCSLYCMRKAIVSVLHLQSTCAWRRLQPCR